MTKHVTKPLADATLDELKTFATVVLGLELPTKGRNTPNKLMALIKQAYDGTILTIPAVVPSKTTATVLEETTTGAVDVKTSVATGKRPAPEFGKEGYQDMESNPDDPNHPSNKMVEIFIDTREEPGGDSPVWISCNGQGIWIPRGQNAMIRYKFVHILENAVQTVYEQTEENGPMVPREVPAYPWRLVTQIAA